MLASEKMAARVSLFGQLVKLDDELRLGLSIGLATLRAAAEARKLLDDRRKVCDEMFVVGYQPWDIPTIIDEERAI